MADKAGKFHEIAERRTNNVLNALRLLGQVSNPRLYEYNEDQSRRIFREIERELRKVKLGFAQNNNRQQFKL